MKEGTVYIFIKWKLDLNKKSRSIIEYEAWDGIGNRVIYSMDLFEPKSNIWNSWKHAVFNESFQEPGKWKFVVRLDDRKVIEKYLTVSSD